jgi:hypothetical protein
MIMRELVSTIQSLLGKIEEGTITQAEMEQLVADARELNERLIVLRYKVYEQGIFEVQSAEEQRIELPEIELNIEISDETIISDLNQIIVHEEKISANNDEMNFSENGEPTVDAETNLYSTEIPLQEPTIELNFDQGEEDEQKDEQIIEENTTITSSFDEKSNIETQEITHHQTSVIETVESTTIIETEETTTITTFENLVDENESSESASSLNEQSHGSSGNSETEIKLKSIEKSLRINYSIVPLETLIGSFTLNERLQFINELFEGSSDSFSSAVKKLDALDGLDAARNVVADFASLNSWDLESEIVEDFLVKICRRYA